METLWPSYHSLGVNSLRDRMNVALQWASPSTASAPEPNRFKKSISDGVSTSIVTREFKLVMMTLSQRKIKKRVFADYSQSMDVH